MIERYTVGPMYDLKYGDDPATGIYDYIGHRIETPGGKLFFAEQNSDGVTVSWSTDFSLDQIRQLVSITPETLAEEVHEENIWFVQFNDGNSLLYAGSFNDERVETPQFGIFLQAADIEVVGYYAKLTAADEVVSRLDELLEISELTHDN